MLDAESRLERDLEEAIPLYINRDGMTKAAERIGVSKATLNYWMLKLGIRHQYIAVPPGQSVTLVSGKSGPNNS